jgi:inner membrane protein involved in colicin E2 resistance
MALISCPRDRHRRKEMKRIFIICGIIMASLPFLLTLMFITGTISSGLHGIGGMIILMYVCLPLSFIAFIYNSILLIIALAKHIGFKKIIWLIVAIIISALPIILLSESILNLVKYGCP